ncbi:hypothetical protein Back11_06880 [Paenibacillus baekrokdamisoli]|uniref:Uncharacterized protein n=1 Tax=Paenibacillus baekrokdamisoli TaxID=1712516 RepID=A0A3G9J3Q5_9BACL|nr:hypothetical protein [Paenibacillus baekrokdamisoli]MBB3067470.1 hypothetical protein [Paenibacillus baekrokdamisoli]BBH19343.1 hypothetical protein Back11_06880 [Paenibacillus baekrokdamisoli]
MIDELQRAKELFLTYLGSTVHMHREGIFEEYRSYQVSQPLEAEWFNEMVGAYTKELSIMNWQAVERLASIAKHYSEPLILENVIAFVSRHLMSADSMVRLMYGERMIDLIKNLRKGMPGELLYRAYKTTIELLEDVIAKPLVIDPGHDLQLFQLRDKKALNNRARRSIEELNDYIN